MMLWSKSTTMITDISAYPLFVTKKVTVLFAMYLYSLLSCNLLFVVAYVNFVAAASGSIVSVNNDGKMWNYVPTQVSHLKFRNIYI